MFFTYLLNLIGCDNILETKNNCSCNSCELDDKELERQIVLSKLRDVYDYLHKRGLKGHFQKDRKASDDMRIKYLKACIQAANIMLSGLKDKDIDELRNDIEKLKLNMDNSKGGYL